MSRIKYAMDAITSFSYKPLRFSFVLAGLALLLSAGAGIAALISSAPGGPLGYGVAASVFLMGGLLLFSIGILSEYIGRVYDEVRGRPLSIIQQVYRTEQAGLQLTPAQASDMERAFPAA
jgi:dolichol-phosphate mannosyltransferase